VSNVLVGVDPNEYAVWNIGLEGITSFKIRQFFGINYFRKNNQLFVGEQWLAYKRNENSHYSEVEDWDKRYFDGTSNQAFHV
jgi:hypothetical protein